MAMTLTCAKELGRLGRAVCHIVFVAPHHKPPSPLPQASTQFVRVVRLTQFIINLCDLCLVISGLYAEDIYLRRLLPNPTSLPLPSPSFGIRCNAVLPGFIETPMTGGVPPKEMEPVRHTVLQHVHLHQESASESCPYYSRNMEGFLS